MSADAPDEGDPARGDDRSVDVVNGRLFRPMMLLAAPIVAAQLLQVGYNLADTFWVGRLGGDPVAALSYSWPIIFLMVSIGGGLTVAGTVLVAQHKGASNFAATDHVAGQTLGFVTLVAAVFAVIGIVLTPWLLQLVGATPGTPPFEMAVGYTRIIFSGILFMFWFFIFDALSRGWGDTRTPLYLMAISVGINVVLDPFLILGFEGNPVFAMVGLEGLQADLFAATGFTGLGVEGAAIATIVARGIAAVVGLYLLFSGHVGLQPALSDLWIELETVRSIVDIGAPIAVEQGLRATGLALLTAVIALAGDDAVAAYGIVNRLSSLMFLPALGLSRGIETVVGQNLGARQVDRAKQSVYLASGVIVAVFVVVIIGAYLNAEAIVSVFVETNAEGTVPVDEVVDIGAMYIWIAGPAYVFLGVFQVLLGAIRGSGSTRAAMVLSIQELWVWRIPLSVLLLVVVGLGVVGVWYAVAISYVASAIITTVWFLRGTWTDSVVDRPESTAAD